MFGIFVMSLLCIPASASPAEPGSGDQVSSGQSQYNANCASCHGSALEGGVGPALNHDALSTWGDANGLFSYFSSSMPPSRPGTLSKAQYVDILAFILNQSHVKLPPTPLSADAHALSTIRLDAQSPSPGPAPAPVIDAAATEPVVAQKPAANLAVHFGNRSYAPVTDAMLRKPAPSEWLMWRRTLDNSGYSPLTAINSATISNLKLAWAWTLPTSGQQEAAPLVHDGIMFISGPRNVVDALDARTGDLLWEYRHPLPKLNGAYQENQSLRQRNSIALYGDDVILSTADAKIVALNAKTGAVVWQTQALDGSLGYSFTGGPVIADGRVLTGASGCTVAGTRGGCFVTALDAHTGRELWRFNTLSGPQESWGSVPLADRLGGSPWISGSYDPDLGLFYIGTGMPAPYAEVVRGSGAGTALYSNSTLAFDVKTGALRWYFQHLPRDNWDLDAAFERILADIPIDGHMSKMLITVAGKNGIAYGLDRTTGAFRWARDTITQNVVDHIDPKTGAATLNPHTIPGQIGQTVTVCPSVSGGKLWQAAAYNPRSAALFVPLAEACNTMTPLALQPAQKAVGGMASGVRFGPRELPPGITKTGVLEALDAATGKPIWRVTQRAAFTSSALVTGGLVFVGDAARYLKAFDQKTGKLVWQMRLNAPIGGFPMVYAVDGHEYLAVPVGFSAQASSSASMYPEITVPDTRENSVFVFRL